MLDERDQLTQRLVDSNVDLKQRVKQHWIPPLAFTALGAIHGYTVVYFRIHPDGRMDLLEVIEEEGHSSLHRSSVNAIQGAAPFRRLPDRRKPKASKL